MARKKYSDLSNGMKILALTYMRTYRPLLDDNGVLVVETDNQIATRVGSEVLYEYLKNIYDKQKEDEERSGRVQF